MTRLYIKKEVNRGVLIIHHLTILKVNAGNHLKGVY